MGGKCCAERKDLPGRALDGPPPDPKTAQKDLDRVEKAVKESDVKLLVQLLPSQAPFDALEGLEEKLEPWAAAPTTVGAYAGGHLAILALPANKDSLDVKRKIASLGAIPVLVDFLSSAQQDRVHTATIALGLLTDNSRENSAATYEAGALEILAAHAAGDLVGLRCAAITVCRHMWAHDEACKSDFVQRGGVEIMVTHLSSEPAPEESLDRVDVQVEALMHMVDIVQDSSGALVPEYVQRALDAGIKKQLFSMIMSGEEEIVTAAEVLKGKIADFEDQNSEEEF